MSVSIDILSGQHGKAQAARWSRMTNRGRYLTILMRSC